MQERKWRENAAGNSYARIVVEGKSESAMFIFWNKGDDEDLSDDDEVDSAAHSVNIEGDYPQSTLLTSSRLV